MKKTSHSHRHDQRVHEEIEHQEAVHEADGDARRQCGENRQADRSAVIDIQNREKGAGETEFARDREVVVPSGKRND